MINNWQRVRVRNKSLCDKTMNKPKIVLMCCLVKQGYEKMPSWSVLRFPYFFLSDSIKSVNMSDSFDAAKVADHIERESINIFPFFHRTTI